MAMLRGAGGLLTTEVERVDLGEHGGRRLTARVERRTLRFGFGHARGAALAFGRLRPVAVEVEEPGRRYEVAIPAVPDPRMQAARRIVLLWLASLLVVAVVRRVRERRRDTLSSTDGTTGSAAA